MPPFALSSSPEPAARASKPVTLFFSENLIQVAEVAGPSSYDPRQRPWYVEAFKDDKTLLTGPYVFYATGQPGYTLRTPLKEGRRGVVAGDLLLNSLEEMLNQQRLGQSGLAFLFNDADRVVGHPEMSRLMEQMPDALPDVGAIRPAGLAGVIEVLEERRRGTAVFRRSRRANLCRGLPPHRDGRTGQHPPRGDRSAR